MVLLSRIDGLVESMHQWLWLTPVGNLPWWQRLLIQALRIFYAVIRDLRDGQLSLRAMSLVYTTVIAIVPLLALSFSVLKGFNMHNRVEPALLDGLEALGDQRFEIVARVLEFVDNVKVGVLGAVGFALLIYSVVSMMHKIERSFNYTWQIKRDRVLSQRFRDYLSVIFVGPLLIFLSVGITTSVNTSAAMQYIEAMPLGADALSFVGMAIPYLIMALGFAFIYMFLPNTKVHITAAIVGGLVTAVIWKIMGWGISTFVANSSNNLAVYSAFASVIILMVWMYVGWLVLLVGASVAFYFQNPQYMLIRRDNIHLSGENNEKLAVNILYYIYLHYQENRTPWNVDALGRTLRVAPNVVDDMVDFLLAQGYLVRSSDDQQSLYPAQPAEQVTLADVLTCVRVLELGGQVNRPIHCDKPVEALFDDLRSVVDERFAGKSFRDLVQ